VNRAKLVAYVKSHYKRESDSKIAFKFHVGKETIRNIRRHRLLRREGGVFVKKKATVADDLKLSSFGEALKDTRRKYQLLLKENAKLKKETFARGVMKATTQMHRITPSKGSGGEATAFALASDWHVEEIVKPETVSWKNEYNPKIARERATRYFQRVLRLVQKERQDVAIHNLVLGLLGDFISGNIHEELLENCAMEPVKAILLAQELLGGGIRFLLENSDLNITVVCHSGNHGRITKKVHVSTESGNSLEYGMYHNLRQLFSTEDRVKFVVAEGYFTHLKVYDSVVRFHHGHSIGYGGGVGGILVPLLRSIYQWNLTEPATVDCIGHFHQYTPHRRAIVNGSLIGYSPFAQWVKGGFEHPTQAFFLIDKKRGLTVQIPIYV